MWTGDNLAIMRGMNSACADLIYLDPPFNSKANYAAPIGSKAAGAAFKDTWGLNDINLAWHGEIKHEYPGLYNMLNAVRTIHGDSMMSYLIYMAPRIMEMKRLLKDTGSIYLHCDPTAGHYLKLIMDAIFGKENFRNEIVWCYSGGGIPAKDFPKKHDLIYRYSKTGNYLFNKDAVRVPYDSDYKATVFGKNATRTQNKVYGPNPDGKVVEDWWRGISRPYGDNRTGYPTQKPLALLERIIKASSQPRDVVLDPFCGCATACLAAEKTGRQWVGIDISPMAAKLVARRMHDELGMFYKGTHREDVPKRTDLGEIPKYNSPRNKSFLYGEQGGYCNGCEEHFKIQNLSVDHIIAQAKGGTDHISNLQLLCGHCNSTKGVKSQEHLIACLTDKGFIKRDKASSGSQASSPPA